MSKAATSQELPSNDQRSIQRIISSLEFDSMRSQFIMRAICLNFFILFCRPQNWPGLSVLGAIRMPMIVSVFVIFLWLPLFSKSMHRVSKMMMFFLVFEMLRGLVGRYVDPNDTLVRNDFKQFHTWKDLFLQFASLSFPLMAAMRSERCFRMMAFTCAVVGILLGFYTTTHGGKGPEGFLGDENDVCLVMVMLLPFAVMLRKAFRGALFSMVCIASSLSLCAGIISTNSRGGFLGFAAVIGLFFIRSDKKFITLASGLVIFLAALPFVPQEYIDEITSIKQEANSKNKESTIQERLDTWRVATRVFLDPKNIAFGVGMNNVPHWFHEYEDVERGRTKKSLSGRAMHSIYFTILPDLGLYGVIVIGMIWFGSIAGNWKIIRYYQRFAKLLQSQFAQNSNVAKPSKVDPEYLNRLYARRLVNQCELGRKISDSLIVSWIGTLVAGVGVSALYYPPVWFLAGCSVAIQLHASQLAKGVKILIESAKDEP